MSAAAAATIMAMTTSMSITTITTRMTMSAAVAATIMAMTTSMSITTITMRMTMSAAAAAMNMTTITIITMPMRYLPAGVKRPPTPTGSRSWLPRWKPWIPAITARCCGPRAL